MGVTSHAHETFFRFEVVGVHGSELVERAGDFSLFCDVGFSFVMSVHEKNWHSEHPGGQISLSGLSIDLELRVSPPLPS